ncbi:MAG TPA: hypothetical protein VF703_02120 [Pyrinomonadaceae bacterium]|jgi:ppGpp synthetase/RelA/SpoT-type nucleotidyltranferase
MTTKKIARGHTKDVDDFVRQYDLKRPLYADFTDKLRGLLEVLLNSSEIKFQVVEQRTKDVQSFREKITRANKNYSDPLREITDLTGLRIIVYYLEDVDLVCKLIEREFSIDKNASIDKGQLLKPNEFGYRSVHYIASLSSNRKDLLEWQQFSKLTAEIQIRTVLQHAWAAISHALQYKIEEDVPSQFRRKLSRLSGLLELSDEEFSALKREQQTFASIVSANIEQGNISLELNAITLKEYIESDSLKFLAVAAEKAGFTIVDKYKNTDEYKDTLSRIIAACNYVGIETIRELEENLQRSKSWAERYFKLHYDNSGYAKWKASISFLVELILLHLHTGKLDADFLINTGWNSEVAGRVAKVARKKL